MFLSRAWLNDYVAIPKSLSAKELGLKLTMSVVEVEGWKKEGEYLDKVVVGRVLAIEKHPNADKLRLALVDIGKEKLKIVCGGMNLRQGMLVAVAQVGARVRWHGEDEWTELVPAKIRGVESRGMICSAQELGLSEKMNPEDGILDISALDAKPGESFRNAAGINDIIYDIDNKSMTHRPDLWGHYGMARELAALFGKKLSIITLAKIASKTKDKKLSVKVEDNKLCPRYCGLVIDNIKVGPSPFWMQKRLASVNVRPINNIVDITNYVLMELGQPLHAFDYNFIPGGEIIVRRAKEKEKITTLDNEVRTLTKNRLVIANSRGPIAVAGIMGGANSEISDKTTSVIIESANFEPYSIRKTSAALGLRSESSMRFEKSLDPNLAELGIRRAAGLILELCPGSCIASSLVDVKKFKLNQGPIKLDLEFLNKKIGIDISKSRVKKILSSLGFGVQDRGKWLSVKVPTWRATKDISISEDLVEEVARIYGYDNIKIYLPKFEIAPPKKNELRNLENNICDILVDFGLSQTSNYSFVGGKEMDKLGLDKTKCIKIKNPVSEDQTSMRTALLPGLLGNIELNQYNYDDISLFEIGSVYWQGKGKNTANPKSKTYLPEEVKRLAAVFMTQDSKNEFARAADTLRSLFTRLKLDIELGEPQNKEPYQHPGRCAEVLINKNVIGKIFELHPQAQQAFDIRHRVGYWEISLEALQKFIQKQEIKFKPLPKFPSVRRDLALVCPEELEYRGLEKTIKSASQLVVSVQPFDVYRGKGLPAATKSIALHLVFRHDERTLQNEDVDKEINKILSSLKTRGVELRK